jgi:membrane peptidoglycan carboxypeptidase
MTVDTTLDIKLQDKIQKIAQQRVAELQGNNVTNSAEVMIDYHTGAVISLLGSIDYNNKSIDGQYDVATQAYRQPGSSFKPYVYATAFKQGFSPGQAIADVPTTFDQAGTDPYSPLNYDLKFHGDMTLRCALQNSLNIPAVKTLSHVGINNALSTAKSMGVTTQGFPGLSLVLGSVSVKLIDHVSGIGTFANSGVHMPYYTVTKIYMNNDTSKPYFVHPDTKGKRAISPQVAYMMTNVLSDNSDRIPDFGDCNPLQLYSNSVDSCYGGDRGDVRPAAAKTGTTNDFKDNWTVGYTTDYVMGVWTGNDDNTPMVGINGIQGAAPIWHDSMLVAEQGKPIRDFTNPGGLSQQTVTYPDGVTSTDWYLNGTGPGNQQPNLQGSINNGSKALLAPRPKKPPVQKAPYCPSYFFSGGSNYGSVW